MTDYFHTRLVLVEPPMDEPLTAAEARARLNINDEVSDQVMDAYIKAAREQLDGADGWLGRALITQTWMMNFDCFPDGRIYFPLLPVQQVSEISYLDDDGLPVVVDPADYQIVQAQRPYLVSAYGSNWPVVSTRVDAISILFVAGYGDDGEDVPEAIRTAIALGAGQIYRAGSRNLSITEEVVEGVGSTRYAVTGNAGNVINDAMQNLLHIYRVIYV